jgi:hypothetical protein
MDRNRGKDHSSGQVLWKNQATVKVLGPLQFLIVLQINLQYLKELPGFKVDVL